MFAKKNKKPINRCVDVKITFTDPKIAKGFLSWLCESGEQAYWNWQECRESESVKENSAIDFDYNFKKLTVITMSGRLDKPEQK